MLQDLGTNTQEPGADEKSKVEVASSSGVEDPVETGREHEEGETVKDFVVDVSFSLEGGESNVACCRNKEQEGCYKTC